MPTSSHHGPAASASPLRISVIWLLILAGAFCWVRLDGWMSDEPEAEAEATESAHPAPTLNSELTAKMLVGFEPFDQQGQLGAMFATQPEMGGTIYDQLSLAATQLRLGDPAAASKLLDSAEAKFPEAGADDRLPGVIRSLRQMVAFLEAHPFEGTMVARAENMHMPLSEQEALEQVLGWPARQALITVGAIPDGRFDDVGGMVVTMIVFVLLACAGLVIGLAWLGVLLYMSVTGKIRSSLVGSTADATLLAEMFLGWLVLSLALHVVLAFAVGRESRLDHVSTMALSAVVALASVLGVGWGMVRGVPLARLRDWLGLRCGQSLFKECGIGFLTWMSGIPLLGVGLIVAMLLSSLFGDDLRQASHPVQEAIVKGGTGERVILYVLAALIAPFVEEIVFRGALYLHIRRMTGAWGVVISIAASALLSSALFAVIHPQGVMFAPVLTGLAVAFCIAREWRGNLVAPMVAHGLNNATMLTLNILLFG